MPFTETVGRLGRNLHSSFHCDQNSVCPHMELSAGGPAASDGSTNAADKSEVGGATHLDKIDKKTFQQITTCIVVTKHVLF